MATIELFILAVGLSLDAFVISVCKGLSLKKATLKSMCIAGIWCGAAQAFVPVIGYFLGRTFIDVIHKFNHWVEFVILAGVGFDMIIKGALFKKNESANNCVSTYTNDCVSTYTNDCVSTYANNCVSHSKMCVLAIVDSFDVLAVSVTFPELGINLPLAMVIIGITTFVIAALGVKIGSIFGGKYRAKAAFCGGIILIIVGTHLLLSGLGIFSG